MLQRTFLRVKLLISLYANQFTSSSGLKANLQHNFEELYKIYISFISLLILSKLKFQNEDDFSFDNPDIDFGKLGLNSIGINDLKNYMRRYKINWSKHPDILHEIDLLLKKYHSKTTMMPFTFFTFFKNDVLKSKLIMGYMETEFLSWDIDFEEIKKIIHFNLKNNEKLNLLSIQDIIADKNIQFTHRIIDLYEVEHDAFVKKIDLNSPKKEFSRIAKIDLLIILLILSENKAFPETSINIIMAEYLEIAKNFSNVQSIGFINGVVGNLIKS